jgi:formamidopyrimidine-DNA glycosylase
LPEVEIVRYQLERVLQYEPIVKVKALTTWTPVQNIPLQRAWVGSVKNIIRHGKYLFFQMDNESIILSHLGMSGSWRFAKRKSKVPDKHDHLVLVTSKHRLYYNDPRRFGQLKLFKPEQVPEISKGTYELRSQGMPTFDLGPDLYTDWRVNGSASLDLAESVWLDRISYCFEGTTLKSLLLDQSIFAGIGNIYASEILLRCKVWPATPLIDLDPKKIRLLAEYSPKILAAAIKTGGTTIPGANPYRDIHWNTGDTYMQLYAYGKDGETCRQCSKGTIKKMKIDGRSTYFCPKCQPKAA